MSQRQRMEALALANEKRLAKAALKRGLAEMVRTDALREFGRLLDDRDPVLDTCRLREALMAVPKIGEIKTLALAHLAGCSIDRRIGDLSDRQRGVLAEAVRNPRVLWPQSRVAA